MEANIRAVNQFLLEVISKPIFGVMVNQPRELKLGKNHPSFLKGDLKPPFPTFNWLREHICSLRPMRFN